jgi:hypothetical protein
MTDETITIERIEADNDTPESCPECECPTMSMIAVDDSIGRYSDGHWSESNCLVLDNIGLRCADCFEPIWSSKKAQALELIDDAPDDATITITVDTQ